MARKLICPETEAVCTEGACRRDRCVLQDMQRTKQQEADADKALDAARAIRLQKLLDDGEL